MFVSGAPLSIVSRTVHKETDVSESTEVMASWSKRFADEARRRFGDQNRSSFYGHARLRQSGGEGKRDHDEGSRIQGTDLGSLPIVGGRRQRREFGAASRQASDRQARSTDLVERSVWVSHVQG